MRVLFVSKPIVPPWNDGSKCLVRDVASHLTVAEPTVMVAPAGPSLGPRVRREPVYGASARFAPTDNALVLNRLLFGDPLDIWHFVFAPNAASSSAAQLAIRARRAGGWKGKVVQTVASRPKSFGPDSERRGELGSRGIQALFFGDRIVALSEWMRVRLLRARVRDSIVRVIPPCADDPTVKEPAALVRERYELGSGPVILYPGDLHVSSGASMVAAAASEVLRTVPGARLVFACRPKGHDLEEREAGLRAALSGLDPFVRILGEVDDMPSLIAAADVVAFPAEDLYGKVDLPIVLLEAMALGRPLALVTGGPLEELPGVHVPPGDAPALARALIELCQDRALRAHHGAESRTAWERKFTPEIVAAQHDALYSELC
ncbi:MAG TPA: glycosyltransferase family 4 protein [Polyangiaceae bacterium]|nr:glycosyltransferase family 4 protein [Polyangiaceae bacterium]